MHLSHSGEGIEKALFSSSVQYTFCPAQTKVHLTVTAGMDVCIFLKKPALTVSNVRWYQGSSGLVRLGQFRWGQLVSGMIRWSQVMTCNVRGCQVMSGDVRWCQMMSGAEFLKGATMRPYGRAKFFRDFARFGFLNAKMHNLPLFYLFGSFINIFFAHFVCAKLSNRYIGCGKKMLLESLVRWCQVL